MSPEQIAGQLRREFPEDPEMRVHHETIYRELFVQGRGALRAELHQCLRSGRARRVTRAEARQRRSEGRGQIPDMVNIVEREEEVPDRRVPGHWEGDLIIGQEQRLGDRDPGRARPPATRCCCTCPTGHGAEQVTAAITEAMAGLPAKLRRSLTWDQGKELSAAQAGRRGHRPEGLLLRPPLALAARHQREHQRAAAPVLPQGHRPLGAQQGRPRLGPGPVQRPTPQTPRIR